jgi:hypothetical protein
MVRPMNVIYKPQELGSRRSATKKNYLMLVDFK